MMKSIIVYYSFSGNTRKLAEVLGEYLRQKGEVEFIELKALDESDKFFGQAVRAFRHKKAEIELVGLDLSKYDLICLGTPVWAFGPAPAMNTYLDRCFGVKDKEVVLFTTYGSGMGNSHCLDYIQKILNQKGAKSFRRFSIQENRVNDKEFVLLKIVEIFLDKVE